VRTCFRQFIVRSIEALSSAAFLFIICGIVEIEPWRIQANGDSISRWEQIRKRFRLPESLQFCFTLPVLST
jgi:hypothetical protein